MHPLAYVTGLRGFCSVMIMIGHTINWRWKWIPDAVLAIPWLKFPLRGGHTGVTIFFWISGYTTTIKLCTLMQTRKTQSFHDNLASGIFRRYFRLFLPILPITLLSGILAQTSVAIIPHGRADVMKVNIFWWWIKDAGHILNPYLHVRGQPGAGTGSKLLFQTWSLVTEFRSSMILYVFCAGTSKLSTRHRKVLIWMAILGAMAWDSYWSSMAFLGMWFAECRVERGIIRASKHMMLPLKEGEKAVLSTPHDQRLGQPSLPAISPHALIAPGPQKARNSGFNLSRPVTFGVIKKGALILMFLYSFVVLKNPLDTENLTLFPHNYLNMLVPDYWSKDSRMYMHLSIGAFMMLLPLDLLPELQQPLLTPFAQYLGELSFGMYVVHLTVKWCFWDDRYLKWLKSVFPNKDPTEDFWMIVLGWLVMLAIDLWASELFRHIDMLVLKFCKWLERKLFVE
jgi:peptidoglycan/LPS O-acetylase OafA/YrhL